MLEPITYDENLSVKVQLLDIRSYPIHKHKDFQIFYVLEGELSLTLFYATYRLRPGSIHIIHTEDVHSIKSITERNLVLVLSFNSSYFQSIFPHFITTVFITNIEEGSFEKRDTLCSEMLTIAAEAYNRSPGYISRINNAAVSLINTLMTNFRGFVIDPVGKAFIHKTSHDYIQTDRISRIIQYVYENYPYKISLSRIAEKEQISPYYLSHIFHKLVGMNFRDFLSMVRVEMSESAVLSSTASISQIAQDVGFSDAKYYIKNFHDYMGYHPREYRKKYSDKIYGAVMPDIKELPLSFMTSILEKHNKYNMLSGQVTKTLRCEISFSSPVSCKFTPPRSIFSVIQSSIPAVVVSPDPIDCSKMYHDVYMQQFPIDILTQLTESPGSFRFPQVDVFDDTDPDRGIFTANGLRKPLYYLLMILESLPEDVTAHGRNYIALQTKNDKYLLLFNDSKTESITADIIVRNVSSNYKLTKYILPADRSYLYFWAQLNFSSMLDSDDIKNINHMTAPDVKFEMIPPMEQYYTSTELAPNDIILMKFSRC